MKQSSIIRVLAIALLVELGTAELAAQTWQPLPDLRHRKASAMAYDPIRKRVVMYGGLFGLGLSAWATTGRQIPLSDTWEWDGNQWHPRFPQQDPGPLAGHKMAWDPVRKEVLLFGGSDNFSIFGETWSWDGRNWTHLQPKNSPPPRYHHDLATDYNRNRLVMFGGALVFGNMLAGRQVQSDTWEWDGKDWRLIQQTGIPPARYGHAMSWSQKAGKVMMFGGASGFFLPLLPGGKNEVWTWDGSRWSGQVPKATEPWPPEGAWQAQSEDQQTGEVLWHAGEDFRGTGRNYETWKWDGNAWAQLAKAHRPTVSYGMMSWDGVRIGHLFLGDHHYDEDSRHSWPSRKTWFFRIGGSWEVVHDAVTPFTEIPRLVHETHRDRFVGLMDCMKFPPVGLPTEPQMWAIEQGQWRRLSPTRMPPGIGWNLCYHAAERKVVAHGGVDAYRNQPLGETWLWDGTDWARDPRTPAPPPGLVGPLVYDSHRQKVVLINQSRYSPVEIWEWDANGWAQAKSPSTLPDVILAGAAYDAARKRIVLWGGMLRSGGDSQETWEWDGQLWHKMNSKQLPEPRYWPRLVYVPRLGGVLAVGYPAQKFGHDGIPWLWDGAEWRKLQATAQRPVFHGRDIHTVAYDPARQRLLGCYVDPGLPCGAEEAPGSPLWEFALRDLTTTQRYPHPGERYSYDVDLPDQAGDLFFLLLSLSDTKGIPLKPVPGIGTLLLPLDVDPLLQVSLGAGMLQTLDSKGKASFAFQIPNVASLAWIRFVAAGFSLNSQAQISAITQSVPVEIVP